MIDKMKDPAIIQIGIVVPDAKTAADKASRIFGIPIVEESYFGTHGGYEHCNTQYMGKPTDGSGHNYLLKMGQVDVEFIEPVGDEPSIWKDYLVDHPKGGIHHMAWLVRDTEKYTEFLASQDTPKIAEGVWETGRYTYYDTKEMGFFMEALEYFDREY